MCQQAAQISLQDSQLMAADEQGFWNTESSLAKRAVKHTTEVFHSVLQAADEASGTEAADYAANDDYEAAGDTAAGKPPSSIAHAVIFIRAVCQLDGKECGMEQ